MGQMKYEDCTGVWKLLKPSMAEVEATAGSRLPEMP